MHIWQFQKLKAKLTQFINEAKMAPQIILRRGEPETVAMSIEKYNELTGKNSDLHFFFTNPPLLGMDCDVERDRSPMQHEVF